MKTYIGKKTISAQPMSAEDALAKGYKVGNTQDKEGYEVMYEDGYMSWSPDSAFKKAYKVAETYIDRINIEKQELFNRICKLSTYLHDIKEDNKNFLHDEQYNNDLMKLQLSVMKTYFSILESRISLQNEYNPYQSVTPTKRQLGDKPIYPHKN